MNSVSRIITDSFPVYGSVSFSKPILIDALYLGFKLPSVLYHQPVIMQVAITADMGTASDKCGFLYL